MAHPIFDALSAKHGYPIRYTDQRRLTDPNPNLVANVASDFPCCDRNEHTNDRTLTDAWTEHFANKWGARRNEHAERTAYLDARPVIHPDEQPNLGTDIASLERTGHFTDRNGHIDAYLVPDGDTSPSVPAIDPWWLPSRRVARQAERHRNDKGADKYL